MLLKSQVFDIKEASLGSRGHFQRSSDGPYIFLNFYFRGRAVPPHVFPRK